MICFHKYPLPLWLKTHRLSRALQKWDVPSLPPAVCGLISKWRTNWMKPGIWFPGENYSQTLNVQYLKGGVNDFHCPFAGALIQARGQLFHPTSQTVRPDYFIMNYDCDENNQSKIISEWNAKLMCYTKAEQYWLYPTLNQWLLCSNSQ